MLNDFLSELVSASIRACGLGLFTLAGLLIFGIRSPSARHAMWTVTLAGMLLQIPLVLVVPPVAVRAIQIPYAVRELKPPIFERNVPLVIPSIAPLGRIRTWARVRRMSLSPTLTGAYFTISILLFARMALGYRALRRLLRDAVPVSNLGPGVFESASFAVPGSIGIIGTRIILPIKWRDWDAVKLRAVLAHERAHTRRRDWLIQVSSHINVCIFWFHPMAWWLERLLGSLAEDSCDDAALSEVNREDYAAALVDIARAAVARTTWRVVSMARDSSVIRRVNRILNCALPIPKQLSRFAWATLAACSVPVIYFSAAVQFASAKQPSISAGSAEPKIVKPVSPLKSFLKEDQAVTLCIAIDNSGSMRDELPQVVTAGLALVQQLKPQDQACILNFDDEVSNGLPHGEDFTNDVGEIQEALTHINSRGGSAMRDAVETSIEKVENVANKDIKALVLITDGNDTSSKATPEEMFRSVQNSGIRLYSIGLLDKADSHRVGEAKVVLDQLAKASRGNAFYPDNLADIQSISKEIAHELGKQ